MGIGGGYARLVSASVCRISGLINIGTFVACTGPTPPPLRLPHCKRPAAAAAAAAAADDDDDFSEAPVGPRWAKHGISLGMP
jgi:hypothetical protein